MVLIQRLDKNNLLLTEKATISSLMKEVVTISFNSFSTKIVDIKTIIQRAQQ